MLTKSNRIGALLGLALLIGPVALAMADDGPEIGVWQKQFEVGVNVLQSSFSNNWNGGDKGSVVWAGIFNANLEKQFSESSNWRNTLKLAYGQTHQQERDAAGDLFWKKPDKTDDMIDFESLFRWTTSSGWDPFVAFNFTSMFQDLNDASGRAINFNPMTFKESAGLSRQLVAEEKKSLLVRAGVAFLQNSRKYFTDPAPADNTESATSSEIAAEAVAEYKNSVLDGRVDVESKLTLSYPISYSGKSEFEDNPVATWGLPEDVADYTTTLDVDWENTFSANITKVISVKLFVRWVYDKYDNTVKPVVENGNLANAADVARAIRKAGQFKQTLALGLSYKWN